MFKKTCVVEIQLSINSDSSNFIKCSDQFNHFIYELLRSDFGCISEMCSIVSKNDSRIPFFDKKFTKKNKWDENKTKPKHK